MSGPISRVRLGLGAAALALLSPATANAQFPAELAGHVVEAGTLQPIGGAVVAVDAAATAALTDATGGFVIRGTDAGAVRVTVRAVGHAPLDTTVTLVHGRTARLMIALEPVPIDIAALEVVARRSPELGHLLNREAIEASGARTLGELIGGVPGVVVRPGSGGTGARVSIRGGAADAVLVLVDGAPANDPLTGEADLSTIPLDDVEAVRVLPGARSARYGPRAAAGVILVDSRRASAAHTGVAARGGLHGERDLEAEVGTDVGFVSARAGVRFSERDDRFDYALPDGLGGGSATRENTAARTIGGSVSLSVDLVGEPVRLRLDAVDVERGLPGPIHAPTPRARQDLSRLTLSSGWRTSGPVGALRVDADASVQRIDFQDPAPAFGPPYDEATRIDDAGVRVEGERHGGLSVRRTAALGAELRALRLESTALDPRVVRRRDVGVFGSGGVELTDAPLAPSLALALRADRWSDEWIVSHDLTARATIGRVALSAAHRSAFSPPSASDQFFRGGIAIAPNPALEPERVRSEIEVGASTAVRAGGMPIRLGASAFRGDVDGMIVWAPDFRFLWSPRNRDVRRSGGEAWLRVSPVASLELGGWGSVARVTYDWPGDTDTVQVVYRPRYSGGATIDWQPGAWRIGIDARYTGVRYATPGRSNPLPAYWEIDGTLTREWRIAQVLLTTGLAVERLLDNRDSFIHGYPEPGRRLRLELRVEPYLTSIRSGAT